MFLSYVLVDHVPTMENTALHWPDDLWAPEYTFYLPVHVLLPVEIFPHAKSSNGNFCVVLTCGERGVSHMVGEKKSGTKKETMSNRTATHGKLVKLEVYTSCETGCSFTNSVSYTLLIFTH